MGLEVQKDGQLKQEIVMYGEKRVVLHNDVMWCDKNICRKEKIILYVVFSSHTIKDVDDDVIKLWLLFNYDYYYYIICLTIK